MGSVDNLGGSQQIIVDNGSTRVRRETVSSTAGEWNAGQVMIMSNDGVTPMPETVATDALIKGVFVALTAHDVGASAKKLMLVGGDVFADQLILPNGISLDSKLGNGWRVFDLLRSFGIFAIEADGRI